MLVQAWQVGYTSGHSRAMRRMSDEPDVHDATNPFTAPQPSDGPEYHAEMAYWAERA